jgi:hypothetical protein
VLLISGAAVAKPLLAKLDGEDESSTKPHGISPKHAGTEICSAQGHKGVNVRSTRFVSMAKLRNARTLADL